MVSESYFNILPGSAGFSFVADGQFRYRVPMRAGHEDPCTRKGVGMRLKLSVHWDAFCARPGAYLTAFWWRLRGKRVRSRSHFAPLLGRARRAYDLWMLLHEEALYSIDVSEPQPPLVALIHVEDAGQGAWEDSLRSLLAEDIMVLPIGTPDVPTLADAACRINWSAKPWLMVLCVGDTLAPGAASAYRAAIAVAENRIVYADDDLLDGFARRNAPHFKPDWNSELFRHFDYLTGACIFQTTQEELQSLSGQDWARQIVARRAGEGTPAHIRKILHHRRTRPAPVVPSVSFKATGELPSVTIIIPTRNRVDLLRTCLNGIANTNYRDVQVIVVDNDSDDRETLEFLANLDPRRHRVVKHAGVFNYSAINNRAARLATGRLLCLLNNDIEIIEPDWLATMAHQAIRGDVGAVGARLLYPDGRLQHAGVVVGVGDAAGHAHKLLHPADEGFFRRHALPQFVSAVTGACLVVERDRFLEADGLDEHDFPVAFNDVDLCLRLNRRGWQSLYEPRATLIHHESVSRGFDHDPVGAARFAGELAALKRTWRTHEVTDPFHHPALSRASEQFIVKI